MEVNLEAFVISWKILTQSLHQRLLKILKAKDMEQIEVFAGRSPRKNLNLLHILKQAE